jgi:hypothetical protein
MKKLMLAVCLLFGGATLVSAQQTDPSATPSQSQSTTDDQDQDKGQQISISQLPDGVTAKLESEDYSGWTIGNAYKKTDNAQAGKEVYTVELKKGTETKSVRFDKDGNAMTDSNDMDDNQGQSHDQGQPSDQTDKQ